MRLPGSLPILTPAQARYVRRAARLRKKLTNVALAQKFGLCTRTIEHYTRHVPKNHIVQGRA
jgi:hypothetical protein